MLPVYATEKQTGRRESIYKTTRNCEQLKLYHGNKQQTGNEKAKMKIIK